MSELKVVSAPTNQPTITGVVSQPAGIPTGKISVAKPAPLPAKLPVVSKPANVQASLSVQPLPQQPSIYVPPKPPEAPQMDKIASDIGVARSRGADDTTILYSLVKKNPALTEDVKVAIQERKATPSQVLDTIVAKYSPQPEQTNKMGRWDIKGFLTPAKDVAVGFSKSLATIGNTALKPLNRVVQKITGKDSVSGALTPEDLKANGFFQGAGKLAGDIVYGNAVAGATAPLSAAVTKSSLAIKAPTVVKKLVDVTGRSALLAGEGYGTAKLMGADNHDAGIAAVVSGALPWAAAALSGLKGTAAKFANKIETSIIKPTKADLADGFSTQNVFKYDLGGSLQQTAQKTNDKITELTTQLNTAIKGSDKKVNVSGLLNQVKNTLEKDKGKTFGANTKLDYAVNFFRDELKQITQNGSVSLAEAQQMKRSVGKMGAWYYGARDPESNAIETVANHLYTKLRLAIENTSPREVAEINNQLSELIPIENAIIRRVPIAERGNVFGLSDIVSALPAVESIKNPANWWLFAINKLSKSGRFANVLNKSSRNPATRGGFGTAIFGAGETQVKNAPTLKQVGEKIPDIPVGLSIKQVKKPLSPSEIYNPSADTGNAYYNRLNKYEAEALKAAKAKLKAEAKKKIPKVRTK